MKQSFVSNVKLLCLFIVVDLLVTMLLMVCTGASFVMMNSLTFKLVAAVISILLTAFIYSVHEHKKLK